MRFNNMMCSTWKISVFGIVALMLAFGLVAGDAFAHSDGHTDHSRTNVKHFTDSSIIVTVNSATGDDGTGGAETRDNLNLFEEATPTLRATEKLDALMFEYYHGSYDHGSKEKKGSITLIIPRPWTQAVRDNNDGTDEPGEVTVSGNHNSYLVESGGGGWRVKVKLTDPPYGTTTITYKKVTVPNRAGKYEFGFSSATVGEGHVSTLNPHAESHAVLDDDPDDNPDPRGNHSHSGDSRNLGTITIAVGSAKDNHNNHEHEGDETGPLSTIGGHRHPSNKYHQHNVDGTVAVIAGGEHTHPYNAGVVAHKHTTAAGPAMSVVGGGEHGVAHTTDGSNTNVATHAHKIEGGIETRPHSTLHGGANVDSDKLPTHTHETNKTVLDVDLKHSHAKDQDGGMGDHEHDSFGDVTRLTSHVHTGASADTTHTHDGDKTVAFSSHSHVGQDGDTLDHEHGKDAQGKGHVVVRGSEHVHTGASADTTHTHDGDKTVKDVLRTRYFDTVNSAYVDGHRHDENKSGYTRTHDHEADKKPVTAVPDHSNHNAQELGQPGGANVHTHSGGVVTGVLTGDHTHTGGNSGDVVMVTAHTHDVIKISVTVIAHKHNSDGTLMLVTAHTQQDSRNDPPGAVDVTVTAHKHNSDDTLMALTGHTHPSTGIVVVSATVIAHTHADATATEFAEVIAHLHGDVIAHTHETDYRSVKHVTLHTHASSSGPVDVVEPHGHDDGAPPGGIDQTQKHVHAVQHNGNYTVRVGPVPSGAGSVTLSNTGTPKLLKRGADPADPYENQYLTTKGQNLGNLRLIFEAAGTMVKGSGIMIEFPVDPSPFPQFYPDNSAGPAGGVSLADSRSRALADFMQFPEGGDSDGISTDALYLVTKTGLEAGNKIAVNVRGVDLKVHGDAPDEDPTGDVGTYTFTTRTASPLVTPDGDDPILNSHLVEAGGPVVRITSPHGSGKMDLTARDLPDAFSQAGAKEPLGHLIFTFTADGGPLAKGSKVEITIPNDFSNLPDFSNAPFEPASDSDERPGAVVLSGPANLTVTGRVLTAETTEELDHGETLTFIYKKVSAPATEKQYTFNARSNSGPHARGVLTSLGKEHQKIVEVTGGHGSGEVSLTRGGSLFRRADKDQQLGTLTFTYTAVGRMAKGAKVQITIPEGWTSAHLDNGDGVSTAGEVTLAGNADPPEVTGGGARPWKLIATTNKALEAGDKLVFAYKSVKAPAAAGSYEFETSAIAFSGALNIDDPGARLKSSPQVGIGQAPDGSGTLSVSKSTAPALTKDAAGAYLAKAGESLGNLTFTFTANKMEIGSSVEVTIPGTETDWPNPSIDNHDGITKAGESVVAGAGAAGLSISGRTLAATITAELKSGNTFTITYKSVNAPTTVGEYDFTAQSKSTPGGTLTNLTAGSPTIKVGVVPVGVVSISTMSADGMSAPLMAAVPGASLGNLMLTYTATARISAGAKVMITVPTGWSAPNVDNNDGVDGAGEVAITTGSASLEVTGGGGQPWMLVATTSAVLASGNTLVFTYKNVTAPSAEGSYTFTTVASISATSTPVAIAAQASVIVRTTVTAIAIEADDSFFAGESLSGMVTLWGGMAAANALGDMVVTLSSDSETGSFTADSITIADNTNGAAFTYNDTAPGTVMLTATSGEITGTKEVTVKSGVAGLVVDPTLVKAGSDVTVTATGKAGGGTVQVMDSEGMQVGATKSLDPVVEPEDGDVTYSRTITLPAELEDGTYTVTVDIQGLTDSMDIEVLNNQAPPTLSDATARPMMVVNGDIVTLVVKATSTIAGDISVMADVSMVDSTKTADIPLTELTGATGTYTTIFTISDSDMNTAEDGEATITITATDRIKNSSMTTVTVTLDNVSDDELTRVWVEPTTPYKPGATAWIKAMGTPGGEASATVNNSETGMMIAQVALEEMEGTPGTYVGGLTIVEDAHPVGTYDVTVTLGNAEAMTVEDALTIEAAGYTFTLSIAAKTHLVHVPLDVTHINGVEGTIGTVGNLYDALGTAVNFIISLGADGNWNSYLGDASAGTAADAVIGDDTGLIAVMSSAATLVLGGEALGTGGVATITLGAGNNLVGLPLDSAQISMISDVVASPLVSAVVVSNAAGDGFNTIAQADDPGDGAPTGGQGYIVLSAAAASIPVIGAPWQDSAMVADLGGMAANGNGASAAPSIGFRTPVLQVQGKLIDETGMMSREGLNVTVKNLSSGVVLGRSTATDTYSMTFVKLDNSAAKIGDVLEIRADSPSTLLGIRAVQHVVTSEDVLNSRISLPDLVTYEIPAQTELLSNYPNPFNPETWIPFRLAEDASVSVTIYGASGSLVRTIDVGFTPAAVYEGRSDAIYWDGRNNFGEQVSSGIYFYHLNAGDFSATRKMVIVK